MNILSFVVSVYCPKINQYIEQEKEVDDVVCCDKAISF